MDNTTTTSKRAEVIEYLMMNYAEIFELDDASRQKTRTNIEQMNESELLYELELIGKFYEKEKGIYQNALMTCIKQEEREDKKHESVPNFSI